MDFYEAFPFTVAQLPFHEESTYPYPVSEHYPKDRKSMHYMLDWNDRFESGNRIQPYKFDYQPVVSEPMTKQ
jgi:hypothetical protein